jgi:hypothetical protein
MFDEKFMAKIARESSRHEERKGRRKAKETMLEMLTAIA